jgi:hypothetical protein
VDVERRFFASSHSTICHLPSDGSLDPPKKSGPVSRVLSRRLLAKATGWPSLWDAPRDAPLATYPATPAAHAALGRTVLKAALFGLAPDGVYPATRLTAGAVSSYLAVSPLPVLLRAVCFLWHFPSPRGVRPLAGILSCGARTFLQPPRIAGTSGHPARFSPENRREDKGRNTRTAP